MRVFAGLCWAVHLCIRVMLLAVAIGVAAHAPVRGLPRCCTSSVLPVARRQLRGQHLCMCCNAFRALFAAAIVGMQGRQRLRKALWRYFGTAWPSSDREQFTSSNACPLHCTQLVTYTHCRDIPTTHDFALAGIAQAEMALMQPGLPFRTCMI